MQTLKQKGFTLIELLVVIVIIGILATISVATFSGYFAKARDSERQAAVRNAATILKTARAVDTISSFEITTASFPVVGGGTKTFIATLQDEGGYSVPSESVANNDYVFIWADATNTALQGREFAIMACSEETPGTAFIDGTALGSAAALADVLTLCDTGSALAAADLTDADYSGATVGGGTFTALP